MVIKNGAAALIGLMVMSCCEKCVDWAAMMIRRLPGYED